MGLDRCLTEALAMAGNQDPYRFFFGRMMWPCPGGSLQTYASFFTLSGAPLHVCGALMADKGSLEGR